VPKRVWPSMKRYRMFFAQTSTLPPCMHQKLAKHGRFWKQNNKLPTKSHIELENNFIVTCNASLISLFKSMHVMFFPGINLKVKNWKMSVGVNFIVKQEMVPLWSSWANITLTFVFWFYTLSRYATSATAPYM
jgi:hypothetical protein